MLLTDLITVNGLYVGGTGSVLTIGPGITVHGQSGQINGESGSFVNDGTIDADESGGVIKLAGTWSNPSSGNLEATGGDTLNLTGNWTDDGSITETSATVDLGGTFTISTLGLITGNGGTLGVSGNWTNDGRITESSTTVNLGGAFTTSELGILTGNGGVINFTGTLTNDGTLSLDGSGVSPQYSLTGGTIIGGTVATPNGGELVATQSGGLLDGVTLDGTLLVGQILNTYVEVKDELTLASTATINMAGNGALNFVGSQSLGGTGSVDFLDTDSRKGLFVPDKGDTLTIALGVTVHGEGGTVGSNLAGSVTNDGTIASDGAGTIWVQGFTNFAAATLAGGTWKAVGNSTLRLLGANIVTNSAGLVLDGTSSHIFSDSASTSALADLFSNTAAGTFTIQNGVTFTPTSAGFQNAGAVIVGAGSTLAAVSYRQTSGSTSLQGGTLGGSPAGTVAIDAGARAGPGRSTRPSVTPVKWIWGAFRAFSPSRAALSRPRAAPSPSRSAAPRQGPSSIRSMCRARLCSEARSP